MNSLTKPHTFTLPSGAKITIAPLVSPQLIPEEFYPKLSPKRRCERYTWQSAARELLGNDAAQFSYNSLGAPIIVGSTLHISASHSSKLAAVIISENPCAIDIEGLDRNFDTVASRYITESEAEIIEGIPNSKAILWSIKEALYKFAGQVGLNLLTDISLHSLHPAHFTASVAPHTGVVTGYYSVTLDHVVVCLG